MHSTTHNVRNLSLVLYVCVYSSVCSAEYVTFHAHSTLSPSVVTCFVALKMARLNCAVLIAVVRVYDLSVPVTCNPRIQ